MMVVQPDIAGQRGLEILGAVESMGGQDLGDPTVETFDHAVGLGGTRLGQTMLDTQGRAEFVERVLARGLPLFRTQQPIRKFLAVIGEQLRDPDRAGPMQRFQEGLGRCGGFVGFDLNEDPAGRAVDGDKEVAALILAGHLG